MCHGGHLARVVARQVWRSEFLRITRSHKESAVSYTGCLAPPSRSIALSSILWLLVLASLPGCALIPDIKHKPALINPFPQLQTIAVVPFFNQSEEPTLSGERVALAYMNELQAIRGFEVLPLGAVKTKLGEYMQEFGPPSDDEGFQQFAQFLGVDAVLVGSITDYDAYYPPRMTMAVKWYAANPGFHPVLPGYGLPWGTTEEKHIPRWVHQESQRALARAQLETQLPEPEPIMPEDRDGYRIRYGDDTDPQDDVGAETVGGALELTSSFASEVRPAAGEQMVGEDGQLLQFDSYEQIDVYPEDWPDPRGFIPDSPMKQRPKYMAQSAPIIEHMRSFNGHDEDFTEQLAEYFYYRDDARFGGWQAYLQRSEDFIRFCCYLHLSETLIARGGLDESPLIFRWPIDRYTR